VSAVVFHVQARPATPSLLKYVTQPTSTVSGSAISPAPVVQVQDEFGNLVDTSHAQVTLSIASGPSGALLNGSSTAVAPAASGVATFSSVRPNLVGTYKLGAASGSLQADISAAFNVAAGAPLMSVVDGAGALVTGSPAFTATAGVAPTGAPALKIADAAGNPIAGQSVTFTIALGGTTVLSLNRSSNAQGLITFGPADTLPTAAGTYTLTASSTTISGGPRAATVTVNPGTASKLLFVGQPTSADANVALSPAVTVKISDAFGNQISTATNAVTLAILSGPTGQSITGAGPVDAVGGLATFADVRLPVVGTTVIKAQSTGLTDASSNSFEIRTAVGPATHLAFVVQPTNSVAGTTISPAVKVEIRDASERVVTSATDPITISFSTLVDLAIANRGPINAVAGVATFSNLSINTAGTYAFKATTTTSGITSATSSSFTIAAGTAADLSVSTHGGHGGPNAIADDELFSTGGPGPKVQLIDGYGNAVAQQDVSVTASASYQSSSIQGANPPGPAAFNFASFLPPQISITPGTRSTNSSGVADFSSAKLNGSIGDLVITFSAVLNGQTRTVTTPVHLNHGQAKKASCSATLPSVVGLSHKLTVSPTLLVLDADENIVNNTSVELVPSTGGSLTSTTATTDGSGVVTGSAWKVGSTAGTHSVGVRNTTGTSCSVKAAAPHHIKLSRSSVATLKNGDAIPSIDATVVDADDNPIEDTTYTVKVVGRSHSNKAISINGSAGSNSHGKSSFSSLIVDAQAQTAATLDFTVDGDATVTGGSVALDVDVGTASVLSIQGSQVTFNIPILGTLRSNKPTVSVKDHNNRNDVSNVEITWSLAATGCTGVSLAATTSLTGNNGQASAPDISAATPFVSCTLTASRTGATSVTFTLTP
jgi:hypothetical protein